MSLQEIKAHLIETISQSENEEELRQLAVFADALHGPTDKAELDRHFAAAHRGQEQIKSGKLGTILDLRTALDEARMRGRNPQ